jgi:hypothetical protein
MHRKPYPISPDNLNTWWVRAAREKEVKGTRNCVLWQKTGTDANSSLTFLQKYRFERCRWSHLWFFIPSFSQMENLFPPHLPVKQRNMQTPQAGRNRQRAVTDVTTSCPWKENPWHPSSPHCVQLGLQPPHLRPLTWRLADGSPLRFLVGELQGGVQWLEAIL